MTESSAAQEAFYRRLWSHPGWDAEAPNADEQARWQAIEGLLAALPRPPESILDLGCGRGWLTRLLADHGSVLGIDPLAASVDRARELFPRLEFRRATTSDLLREPSPPRFELIVSSEVLEHVPAADKPVFLDEIRKLLTVDGHLVLTTPRGELWQAWSTRAADRQPVEDWVSERELDELARAAGFQTMARRRARLPRRPLNWQGFVLRRVLDRRGIRSLPLTWLRERLAEKASLYQVVLLRSVTGAAEP